MTWKQLATNINDLTPEQQNTDVTVYVGADDEFFPLGEKSKVFLQICTETDVLDKGDPFLSID